MSKKVETCPVCGVGETICHADWCTIQSIYVFGKKQDKETEAIIDGLLQDSMDLFWIENSNLFDK